MTKLYEKVGTVAYMSPEILKSKREDNRSYSEKCDIWSVGIITYLLLFKDYPIKGKNQDERDLRDKVKNFNIESEINKGTKGHPDYDEDSMFGSR